MFTKKEIKDLADKAYKEFLVKHKVSCSISLIELNEFWDLARKSKLLQLDLKQKIPLKVGALVVHGEKDKICLNQDIINQLTNDENFIKAIVIHELYHIYLKKKVNGTDISEAIKSENRADNYLEKEFPLYSKYFF